jgi:hypothetical protein
LGGEKISVSKHKSYERVEIFPENGSLLVMKGVTQPIGCTATTYQKGKSPSQPDFQNNARLTYVKWNSYLVLKVIRVHARYQTFKQVERDRSGLFT